MAHHFMQRFSLETKKNIAEIAPDAMERLLEYDWPGNVRELGNVIEHAVVLGQGPKIALDDLPSRIIAKEPRVIPESPLYREGLNTAKREMILKALSQAQGNRAAAAKALGLDAKYFLRLMKSLGID